MALSDLIRKGGLERIMTATVATPATLQGSQAVTVAEVATVAVANQCEVITALSTDEELSIRVWLDHINETDQTIIEEVIDKCRSDLAIRQYLLHRCEEIPEPNNSFQFRT